MLNIIIPGKEYVDDFTQEIKVTKSYDLVLEHSLLSISKWEQVWKIPYLATKNKTREQSLDYIRCMTITSNIPIDVYSNLTDQNFLDISNYINDPMTATTIHEFRSRKKRNSPGRKEILTSEVLYSWMIALNIPIEFQKWHINRLITLIRVCDSKNQPPMSKAETLQYNRELNEQRRKERNTTG